MDAEKMGAADLTLKQLTELMGNCAACHATWRLADEGKR
jgi:cytochrome c556